MEERLPSFVYVWLDRPCFFLFSSLHDSLNFFMDRWKIFFCLSFGSPDVTAFLLLPPFALPPFFILKVLFFSTDHPKATFLFGRSLSDSTERDLSFMGGDTSCIYLILKGRWGRKKERPAGPVIPPCFTARREFLSWHFRLFKQRKQPAMPIDGGRVPFRAWLRSWPCPWSRPAWTT